MKETQYNIPNKSALPCSLDNCRALILYEADKLSTDALLYIKWLLERYKGCNKVFFCCSDVAKLQAIKTICTVVELLPPSKNEIVEVLKFIAKQEGIDLPHQLAERFAENSKNSLRLAIRSFEATWKKGSYPFKEDQVILTGWEDEIADIGKNMIEEQSPKQLYIIRGKLQNLILHGVSPEFIFKSLVAELKKYLDENMQVQVESMYDEYSRNDETMFESDKALTLTRHQEMGKRLNDPSRKNIQRFLRIEGKTPAHESEKINIYSETSNTDVLWSMSNSSSRYELRCDTVLTHILTCISILSKSESFLHESSLMFLIFWFNTSLFSFSAEFIAKFMSCYKGCTNTKTYHHDTPP
ncbi:putative DNA polymerase III, clamp loader complex, gamma/delta/delta subunit [Rosa chinensis]|uniref:Putative DNA polymerase III, clamp loader complex, gamma/delta/delta subunit n=1 Tax=Rosa chinensis TaxID=74649 RepID=A0A2P6SDN3_ROSCH|nr:putative DNA polymerase III, clamp loader complex, gamma/delta/delta subunit [Rosa chinensis]